MPTALATFDSAAVRPKLAVNQWALRLLPALTDLVFLLPLFVLFSLLPGSKLLLSDADMGWHIRTGEWILTHHHVPTADLFSFTRPGAPWFAWEWGWDVCFGAIHKAAGLSGVVIVNALILSLVSVLTFRLVRRACGNDLLSFVLTGIAVCGSTLHWLARPHLTSWLFFLVFAHLISRASEGRTRLLWWLPLLTALWTNVHGSFFLGIGMVAVSAAAPWLDWTIHGGSISAAWQRSKSFFLCLLGCAPATLLNPYGWHLHEHILRYLRDSRQMDAMQEFQSINFHHIPAPLFEAMLLLGAAALFWCARERRWDGFLTLLLWAHWALFSVRNVPMFLFLASPWIGCMLAGALRSETRLARCLMRPFEEIARDFRPLERIERFHLLAAAGFAFVACAIATGQNGFNASFDPKTFPASALKVIDQYKPQRVFAHDQWSAYLIYERFPALRVFIDDRSDFYGSAMLDRASYILQARWDWEADLLRFSTDMVIVAPDAPVATVLKSSPRWQLVLDDRSVVVFTRRFSPAVPAPPKLMPAREISAVASNGGSKLGA